MGRHLLSARGGAPGLWADRTPRRSELGCLRRNAHFVQHGAWGLRTTNFPTIN
jgi:hypothetical protein